jgi:hypothetical protein
LFPKTKLKSLQEHERVAINNLGMHAITGNVSTTSTKKLPQEHITILISFEAVFTLFYGLPEF